jgi:hypothetical protein
MEEDDRPRGDFGGRQSGVSHRDINDYFIRAIKQRSKKPERLAFSMDPARLMTVIEQ